MRHSHSYQRRSASANRSDYEQLFIHRVHELVKLGYDRLCPSAYATQEETVITGDLVEVIESVLEDANKALASSPKSFGLQAQRNNFRLCQISAQLHHTYVSEHRRTTDGKRLQIYHSFLIFH